MSNISGGRGTYVIFGDLVGLDEARFARMLERRGLRHEEKDAPWATLVWVTFEASGKYDKRAFRMRSRAKNVLDASGHEIITNKRALHLAMRANARMRDIYARHFARTWGLREFAVGADDLVARDRVFIARPSTVGFASGRGITRITARADVDAAVARYKRMGQRVADGVIVSEYLSDPYLFYPPEGGAGLKFHLRMYMLFRACDGESTPRAGGGVFWELFGSSDDDARAPRAKILTAREPYERARYDRDEIHDTHAGSTAGAWFFPTHASAIRSPDGRALDVAEIWSQMARICGALAELMRHGGARPYPESEVAFEVFGLDVMVVRRRIEGSRADPCAVLLEVNDRVGYATPRGALFDRFQDDYFEWVWARGIEPCLRGGGTSRLAESDE